MLILFKPLFYETPICQRSKIVLWAFPLIEMVAILSYSPLPKSMIALNPGAFTSLMPLVMFSQIVFLINGEMIVDVLAPPFELVTADVPVIEKISSNKFLRVLYPSI